MKTEYNYQDIEGKWQNTWEQEQAFHVKECSDKPQYYCLSMLPYPSGKLHMGHVRNFTISDVLARFHWLNGFNVLHPFGFDAFGLPAENAALQSNMPPAQWTYSNINTLRRQLKSLGLAVDWSRELITCKPEYYRHQQWFFIKLYERGLIYKKSAIVNWDPVDQTVLANEQVIDGRGWRSGALVEKKEVPMFYCKITAYADELLADLDQLTGWPEQVKNMQRNWIGKSEGLEIDFYCSSTSSAKIEDAHKSTKDNTHSEQGNHHHLNEYEVLERPITVFTTRADTLYGVTFIAISARHVISTLAARNNQNIKNFIAKCEVGGVSEAEIAKQDKEGVFSGYYATHPLTNELVPIWIANYVLADYGTGAIMGVPAHCERDFEFAKKYQITIKPVIACSNNVSPFNLEEAYATSFDGNNILINSEQFTAENAASALKKISQQLIMSSKGRAVTNYRLRDWGISRQRYWGCPIPIINCPNCGTIAAKVSDLPIVLPEDKIPNGKESPLKNDSTFCQTTCHQCGSIATRETDTMDTFFDSSWYFARYACYDAKAVMLDERANYWLPVDQYVGGIEHAVLHLLYARFFYKCLRDFGLINHDEPFKRLLSQGMVLANTYYRINSTTGAKEWFNANDVVALRVNDEGFPIDNDKKVDNNIHDSNDGTYSAHKTALEQKSKTITRYILKTDNQEVFSGGMEKMSKSKNNGVDPDAMIARFGVDAIRLFSMFAASPELSLEWSENGLEGASRFVRKIWRITTEHVEKKQQFIKTQILPVNFDKNIDRYPNLEDTVSQNILPEAKELLTQLHSTIKKVTHDIQIRQQFNTAIAAIMELINFYQKWLQHYCGADDGYLQHIYLIEELLRVVLLLLYSFTPHICSELWEILCPTNNNILNNAFPVANENYINTDNVQIVIQINGKLRATINVQRDLSNQQLESLALQQNKVKTHIGTKTPKRIVVIANKLVNIVL